MRDISSHVLVAYSLAICAVAFLLACIHFRSELKHFRNLVRVPVLKYLVYRPAFGQRILIDWSRADVLALLAYLGVTIFCVYFKSSDLAAAGLRAASLSLIHMVLLFASPSLDAVSNALGLRWRPVRRLHATVAVMASLLLVFHVI
ncbi:hypothetical protein JDV02_001887 [Purpureocillium takamizusanense]|uniref:Ferric oxidoreductase domain-containing protein n=1 Tax=Purpureocillium takamizusanense TaxID=2060973 RepID=A0A9Q8V816_9HYPO|nr:uncharacterized protein JDV02_001887 [Purpureocillium takamizusanense]UNI15347.1 hypothetical protein JDV02_001887 [Purpureocillium takamizusanense]